MPCHSTWTIYPRTAFCRDDYWGGGLCIKMPHFQLFRCIFNWKYKLSAELANFG